MAVKLRKETAYQDSAESAKKLCRIGLNSEELAGLEFHAEGRWECELRAYSVTSSDACESQRTRKRRATTRSSQTTNRAGLRQSRQQRSNRSGGPRAHRQRTLWLGGGEDLCCGCSASTRRRTNRRRREP